MWCYFSVFIWWLYIINTFKCYPVANGRTWKISFVDHHTFPFHFIILFPSFPDWKCAPASTLLEFIKSTSLSRIILILKSISLNTTSPHLSFFALLKITQGASGFSDRSNEAVSMHHLLIVLYFTLAHCCLSLHFISFNLSPPHRIFTLVISAYVCLSPLSFPFLLLLQWFFSCFPSLLRCGLTPSGAEVALCFAGQQPPFIFILLQDGWSALQTALPRWGWHDRTW